MGIAKAFKALFERLSHTPAPDDDFWYRDALRGPTHAGVHVSEEGAMRSATVGSCIRVISGTEAKLPLNVYQTLDNGGNSLANGLNGTIEHPLNRLLDEAANPYMTAFEWKERVAVDLESWGNHYSIVDVNGKGVVTALWPLRPGCMQVEWREPGNPRSGKLYTYSSGRGTLRFLEDDLLHIPGLGFDGLKGKSPIGMMIEQIGLDIALDEFGSRFFGQGASPRLVLKHPQTLSEPAMKRLQESLKLAWTGLSNAHAVAILEEGLDVKEISLPPDHAQFIETHKFSRGVLCGWFQVPPHMIGDTEKTSSWGTGIEQQKLGFYDICIGPRVARIEKRLDISLLGVRERSRFFCYYDMKDLMRGDAVSRSTYYRNMTASGAMNPNEIRHDENLNAYEGGDHYQRPLNMNFIDSKGRWVTPPAPAGKKNGGGNGKGKSDQAAQLPEGTVELLEPRLLPAPETIDFDREVRVR